MALNSQLNRSSSVQMLLFCVLSPPFPTGTFTVFIRQALAHCYAGIAGTFSGTSILLKMLLHHGG